MDLWIRSQDKRELVIATHFEVEQISDDEVSFNVNSIYFGTYKTKERALEVLDDIQDFMQQQIENMYATKEQEDFYGDTVKYFKEYKKTNCLVYEMPKE